MAKGRFGLPRPFAIEKEELNIEIQTDERIQEATASAANGMVIRGELNPFFEISGVTHLSEQTVDGHELPGSTSVRIDVTDSFVNRGDIRMFINNLNDLIENRVFESEVGLLPSISVNRRLADPEQVPQLLIRITTSRGTREEFEREANELLEKDVSIRELLDIEEADGERSGYFLAGGLQLSQASEITREFLGPRNKRTAEMDLSVLGVEAGSLR